ncbi:MAG: 2-amino-4-hydroxy-6-hydroxymethyldihydropteridine diphosphokinase [Enterobacteriaceae bacterium]|jgi:2-amino-4-hydroxy-6-hydroxymethyldihydropteridine diphosphokinase|nr:2-amino-4-hydroxy-6-hydroxymethyldihydropteridine diphosphokinase [Enterobacteriaceae bacterium]
MDRVYIAVGSNLAFPLQQVENALAALKTIPDTTFITRSSFYRAKPMGPQDQPDYLNLAVALDTDLPPDVLLTHTQAIELAQGRVRKENERWGPRTLDLDIMLFGDLIIDTEHLTIPHYGLKQREFMLYPLAEIAPDLVFPDQEPLTERLKHVPENGLTFW